MCRCLSVLVSSTGMGEWSHFTNEVLFTTVVNLYYKDYKVDLVHQGRTVVWCAGLPFYTVFSVIFFSKFFIFETITWRFIIFKDHLLIFSKFIFGWLHMTVPAERFWNARDNLLHESQGGMYSVCFLFWPVSFGHKMSYWGERMWSRLQEKNSYYTWNDSQYEWVLLNAILWVLPTLCPVLGAKECL